MENRRNILTILFFCISSMCYANRTSSECDSIRSFLEFIGETEPYISQIIENTNVPYDSIVFWYEVGFSYNEFEEHGYWTMEPSRVNLGKDYYIRRIVSDTALYNLHILYNRFVSTQNNDSLIYCFQYATEKFRDPFAATYYKMLRQLDFRRDKSQEKECLYLYSIMEYAVLVGDFKDIIDCSIILQDSILLSELKLANKKRLQTDAPDTYFGQYTMYLSNVYKNNSLAILSDEDTRELEKLLMEGSSHGEHSCAAILAFAKITGMILDKNVIEGKQILSSIWPQVENSPFGVFWGAYHEPNW